MLSLRHTLAAVSSVAALAFTSVSFAQAVEPGNLPGCQIAVETGSDQWIVNDEPFIAGRGERQFDVLIVNRGDQACSGTIGLDLNGEPFGLARSSAESRLAYAVVDETSAADITPRAGTNARRIGARPVTLAPGERTMRRFSFLIDPSDQPSAGFYTQTAFVSIEQSDGAPLVATPIVLGFRVPQAAMMGLKGAFTRSGGVATVDLGPLTEGARSLNTSLYVLSTGGYSVVVSSDNYGRLRQGVTDWYVPYTLTVGDASLDLASPRTISVQSEDARSDDYPLSVIIGELDGVRAGAYKDVIRFTVAAL